MKIKHQRRHQLSMLMLISVSFYAGYRYGTYRTTIPLVTFADTNQIVLKDDKASYTNTPEEQSIVVEASTDIDEKPIILDHAIIASSGNLVSLTTNDDHDQSMKHLSINTAPPLNNIEQHPITTEESLSDDNGTEPLLTTPITSIIINNKITEEMLQYKHWSRKKPYEPSVFTMSINGYPLDRKTTITIPIPTTGLLEIVYHYEFLNGVKKDTRTITFPLNPNTNVVDLSFSWHDKNHIIIKEQSV